MVTDTSIEAYKDILPELGSRQQFVLNGLKTLGIANNKLIAHILSLGINQVTARMMELRDMKLVTFAHEAPCPITQKKTNWWKLTRLGDEIGESMPNPKRDILILRPFLVYDGLDNTRYTAQIKSFNSEKFYDVEFIRTWERDVEEFLFIKRCDCKAFQFKNECKHCDRLLDELKKWGEV